MKKTVLALITLVLIVSMLFSCNSAQQESSAAGSGDSGTSVAESGDNENSTSESSATDKANTKFPNGYPEEFTHGKYRFKRMQGDLYSVYGKTEDEKYALWLWNSRTALPELFSSENAAYVRPDADYCINKEVVVIDKCHYFSTYGEYFGNYFTSNPIDNTNCGGRLAQYGFIAQTGETRVGFRMECGKLIAEDIPDVVEKITLYDAVTGELCDVEAVYREPVSGTLGRLDEKCYFRIGDKTFGEDMYLGEYDIVYGRMSGEGYEYNIKYITYTDRYWCGEDDALNESYNILFVAGGEFKSFRSISAPMTDSRCPFFLAYYYDEERGTWCVGIYNFKGERVARFGNGEKAIFSPDPYVQGAEVVGGFWISDYRLIVINSNGGARSALLSDYVGKNAWKPVLRDVP